MWDLGFLINETTIALSGRMVCTAQAPVLCGIWVFLSMKHQLRRVAGWSPDNAPQPSAPSEVDRPLFASLASLTSLGPQSSPPTLSPILCSPLLSLRRWKGMVVV